MYDTFTMDDAKQMLKEILASTTDLQKRMAFQPIVPLSGEVASLKVDQGRLHVAVNKVQSSQLNNDAKNDKAVGEPLNEGSSQVRAWLVPSSMRPPTNFVSPSMTAPRIPCRG
jgi:hypothetical protein